VGLAVFADGPGSIQGDDDGKTRQCDVVENLVDGPLDESRIKGDYGPEAGRRHSGGESDCVLFGDPHVV